MKFKILVILSTIVSCVGISQAETTSLDEIRAYAIASSPSIKSIDSEYASKLREALETGTLNNPEVEFSNAVPVYHVGARPDNEIDVGLSQKLRISDFGARSEVKRLISESASLDQKLALLEISQNIRLNYTRLWAHQEKGRLFGDAKKRVEGLSKIVNRSLANGLVGKGQALTFEAEAKKLEAQKIGIEGDLLEARASLIKLSSYPKSDLHAEKPTLVHIPANEEIERMIADSTFPPRKRAELRLRLAQAQLSVAKKDAFPSLTPKIFYTKSAEGFEQVGGGVALEIPLWYRNEGEISQREAENRFNNANQSYIQGEAFKAEVSVTKRRTEELMKQSNLYEADVLPRLKEASVQLSKGYEVGNASVFEILQAQRELLDAESEALDLYVKAIGAQVELTILFGNEF